ncbi:MAG: DUF1028 domain-containing protein [Jatrophihabitantaceae bacterium]
MTFSIVARSDDGKAWGVAVASRFLAVGNAVPAARAGVGAIATQASANVSWKQTGLQLLAQEMSAQATLQRLLDDDPGRNQRQVGIVDAAGESVTYTGSECMDWAGGIAAPGVAIQGNILTGEAVVDAIKDAWDGAASSPLARRLLLALTAGDAAGGDRRGRQSAGLLVVQDGAGYGGFDDVAVSLRVDDHREPVRELARLLDLNDFYLTPPPDDDKLPVDRELAADLDRRARGLGHADFWSWVGTENYEMRVADDLTWIDRRLLDIICGRT